MNKKLLAIPVALGMSLAVHTATASAHTVQQGDTMSKIASANGMNLQQLANLNPQVSNLDRIYVGQNIRTTGTASNQTTRAVSNVPREAIHRASTSDEQLMAQLVEAEAGNQPFIGKVAVASVILNRVASGSFPNTVSGVIYQGGQFSTVASGAINNSPTESDYQAVRSAMTGNDTSGGALYFYNPSRAGGSWWDSMATTAVIGEHTFKR